MASVTKRCRHRGAARESCGCRHYLRRRRNGREEWMPLSPDRDEAERQAATILATGERPDDRVDHLVERWLKARAGRDGARSNTISSDRSRARHIVGWFTPMRVQHVRAEHLSAFARDLLDDGLAPATVRGIYHAMTSVLRMAVKEGLIRTIPTPVDGPGIPTARPRNPRASVDELWAATLLLPRPWRWRAQLVMETGLRWGELTALDPRDVHDGMLYVRQTRTKKGTVNPPKSRSSERWIPLSTRARRILSVLDLPIGGHYSWARKVLLRAYAEAGIYERGMGWHTLRHAAATRMDLGGLSLRDQAALLGHGPRYAQSLAYGVAAEAHHTAGRMDEVMHRGASSPRGGAGARTRAAGGRRAAAPPP